MTALLVLLPPALAFASSPGAANAHNASNTFPLGSSTGPHTLSGAPFMSAPTSHSTCPVGMSGYLARMPPDASAVARYTPFKSYVPPHASFQSLNTPEFEEFDDTGVHQMPSESACPSCPGPSRGMFYPCDVLYSVVHICHHWLPVALYCPESVRIAPGRDEVGERPR